MFTIIDNQVYFETTDFLVGMTKEATNAWRWAFSEAITEDTPEDIWHLVREQSIVSYCTSKGSVSFDADDFIYGDAPWQ